MVLSKPQKQARSFFYNLFANKKTGLPAVGALVILIFLFNYRNKKLKKNLMKRSELSLANMREKRKKKQGHVDMRFLKNFIQLIKIAMPHFFSKLTLEMVLMMASLISRTFLSIYIASVNGSLVKAIMDRNLRTFGLKILTMCIVGLPASFINSYINYLNKSIGYQVRENLTRYFHDIYVDKIKYYQVINLDSRIENPDQRLTNDIERFSISFANLYSNVSKPILDIFLFGRSLGQKVGYGTVSLTFVWYLISAAFLKLISPPMGLLTSIQQNCEGEFRAQHSNIKTFSQEIGFLNGARWEKNLLKHKFSLLYKNKQNILNKRMFLGIFDSMMVRYGATLVGYFILSKPTMNGTLKDGAMADAGERSGQYIRNGSLMINLAKSVGRIVVSYKDLQNIAGYTVLITEIKTVLEDLLNNKYSRTQLSSKKGTNLNYREKSSNMNLDIKNRGKLIISQNSVIEFNKVPLVTPNGDVLVESMSFKLNKGENLIISGPNGCGKSSLFRIMGGLWPLLGGQMQRPELKDLFYLPQRPYLSEGTLKEQVIYPNYADTGENDDDTIIEWLEFVDLHDLVKDNPYKALEEVQDWNEVLSGGEKQRIAMARLLFHRPKFAVLDECSSTVSEQMESKFYDECKRLGVSLFTISHRQSLFKFHDYYLKFDGNGGYEYLPLNEKKEETN